MRRSALAYRRAIAKAETLNRYYNTPARLVVLIQEICNKVVRNACEYMCISAEPRS
jgi:hypothetical protein